MTHLQNDYYTTIMIMYVLCPTFGIYINILAHRYIIIYVFPPHT